MVDPQQLTRPAEVLKAPPRAAFRRAADLSTAPGKGLGRVSDRREGEVPILDVVLERNGWKLTNFEA
jgi:hypothetical protein